MGKYIYSVGLYITYMGLLAILVGKPKGDRRFWRHKLSCEDNIKMSIKSGYEEMGWAEISQSEIQWRAM
jgi:hypothetical protein